MKLRWVKKMSSPLGLFTLGLGNRVPNADHGKSHGPTYCLTAGDSMPIGILKCPIACIIDLASQLCCGGALVRDGGADDMGIFSREGISQAIKGILTICMSDLINYLCVIAGKRLC